MNERKKYIGSNTLSILTLHNLSLPNLSLPYLWSQKSLKLIENTDFRMYLECITTDAGVA